MRKLTRYQNGTLEEVKTAEGMYWYIRFTDAEGKRPRFRVGLKSQLPTKAKASRAAQFRRDEFNDPTSQIHVVTRTFGDVISRYEAEEMPERHSTAQGYRKIHRLNIRPRWGSTPLADMDAMEVRQWLLGLDYATRTRGHILGQMRQLFKFAMLWKWLPATVNPMALFSIPGSSKRTKKPRVINPAQFRELIRRETDIVRRTGIIGAYCLGLRASELFALRWGDFDFLASKVWIRRAIVDNFVGDVKTERSGAPLPLAKPVADAFLALYAYTNLKDAGEWVFASKYKAGRFPMRSTEIQSSHLVPAGAAIGLDFNLGWHTFRHSYKVLLERSGTDVVVQRDLMRHADVYASLQMYGEIEFDRMCAANEKAVALAFQAE